MDNVVQPQNSATNPGFLKMSTGSQLVYQNSALHPLPPTFYHPSHPHGDISQYFMQSFSGQQIQHPDLSTQRNSVESTMVHVQHQNSGVQNAQWPSQMQYSVPVGAGKPKEKKIPRPLNAFLIFSQDHRMSCAAQGTPNGERSTILAKLWRDVPVQVRQKYQDRARQLSEEHKQKYPDYRFNPKSKATKEAERQKLKIERMEKKAEVERVKEERRMIRENKRLGYTSGTNIVTPARNTSDEVSPPKEFKPISDSEQTRSLHFTERFQPTVPVNFTQEITADDVSDITFHSKQCYPDTTNQQYDSQVSLEVIAAKKARNPSFDDSLDMYLSPSSSNPSTPSRSPVTSPNVISSTTFYFN